MIDNGLSELTQKIKQLDNQALKSMITITVLIKCAVAGVGMFLLWAAFVNPSLFVLVPCAILVFLLANIQVNIDTVRDLLKQEFKLRVADK